MLECRAPWGALSPAQVGASPVLRFRTHSKAGQEGALIITKG